MAIRYLLGLLRIPISRRIPLRRLLSFFLVSLWCIARVLRSKILGPFFKLRVIGFIESVSKVFHDSFTPSINDIKSDCLQRISIHLKILQVLMKSEKVGQLSNLVVFNVQMIQVGQVERKSSREFSDLV